MTKTYKLHMKVRGLEGDYYAVAESVPDAIVNTMRLVYESTGYAPDITDWREL